MNEDSGNSKKTSDIKKHGWLQKLIAAIFAVVWSAIGYLGISALGFTAVGLVGGGAGIGFAAGTVGMVIGAIVGLALYGIWRASQK